MAQPGLVFWARTEDGGHHYSRYPYRECACQHCVPWLKLGINLQKPEQDAAHEPRMQSRKTHLWNKLFEKACTFFPCYRYQNVEWGGMQSVECEESEVLSGECSV